MATPTITTTLRLPPELHAQLEQIRKDTGEPINTLVIQLIEAGIDNNKSIKG